MLTLYDITSLCIENPESTEIECVLVSEAN